MDRALGLALLTAVAAGLGTGQTLTHAPTRIRELNLLGDALRDLLDPNLLWRPGHRDLAGSPAGVS